uniref:Uncharacterized protein n=1 Tax=Anopheles minimus TaxID=112268 RepID=A0A182VWL8_9DIPT
MYPWYREAQLSVGQLCSPLAGPTPIKTENNYSDCMLAVDFPNKRKDRLPLLTIRRVGIQSIRHRLIKTMDGMIWQTGNQEAHVTPVPKD